MSQNGPTRELLHCLLRQLAELEKSGGLRLLVDIQDVLKQFGTVDTSVPRHQLTAFRPDERSRLFGEVANTVIEVGILLSGYVHSSPDGMVYLGPAAVARAVGRDC